ncbi:HalOD1 output domain-containing protein [Halorarum halobium]|uniref:HalOD1 output domain-containing protein n=1 Tax=Halorarum halobium TaxID=3075121 RepID=UPI0028B132D6|nr:HalOD1 output domain-containing protein [Halobaculum sp. XH14]
MTSEAREITREVGTDTLVGTIVDAVAAAKRTDPTELDTRLNDAVDPDAIESLFDTPGSEGRGTDAFVQFGFAEHEVRVHAAGEVTVTPTAASTVETPSTPADD